MFCPRLELTLQLQTIIIYIKFNDEHPDAFVFGVDLSLIEGFQNRIMGLEQGDKFDFTLQPHEAFGNKDPELIYELEKEIFHVEGKFDDENIRPGAFVPMMTKKACASRARW